MHLLTTYGLFCALAAPHPEIGHVQVRGTDSVAQCRGTLIAPDVVLTSATCFDGHPMDGNVAGMTYFETADAAGAPGQCYVARRVALHPDYVSSQDPNVPGSVLNVALVYLSEALRETPAVLLPPGTDLLQDGANFDTIVERTSTSDVVSSWETLQRSIGAAKDNAVYTAEPGREHGWEAYMTAPSAWDAPYVLVGTLAHDRRRADQGAVYARIDALAPWLVGHLKAECDDRPTCTPLTFAHPPATSGRSSVTQRPSAPDDADEAPEAADEAPTPQTGLYTSAVGCVETSAVEFAVLVIAVFLWRRRVRI